MKFSTIDKGESLAAGHEGSSGWMEIFDISFKTNRHLQTPTGSSGKREAGAPTISELELNRPMDSVSPLLFQQSVVGKKQDVTIEFTQTGTEQLETYLALTLRDTYISRYGVVAEEGRPLETISLNFAKIEFKYTPYDDTGTPGSSVSFSYDKLKAKSY